MSIEFSAEIVYGADFKSVIQKEIHPIKIRKYDEDTGEPYELNEEIHTYIINGVVCRDFYKQLEETKLTYFSDQDFIGYCICYVNKSKPIEDIVLDKNLEMFVKENFKKLGYEKHLNYKLILCVD